MNYTYLIEVKSRRKEKNGGIFKGKIFFFGCLNESKVDEREKWTEKIAFGSHYYLSFQKLRHFGRKNKNLFSLYR